MSDTLVEEPAIAEPTVQRTTPPTFGKGAIAGIIVGAVIVIAAAFGGGFLVGSGANASSLGPSSTSQQAPGGAGGFPQNGQQGGPGQSGQQGVPGQSGQQGGAGPNGQNGPGTQQG
jgi:hypothetical protein